MWTDRQLAMLKEMGLHVQWPGMSGPSSSSRPGAAAAARTMAVHHAAQEPNTDARTPASPPDVLTGETAQPARPPAATRAPILARPGSSPPSTGSEPAAQRVQGIERMDALQLRQVIATCEACSLSRSRTQTVYGVGHEHAQWMIVGEAPGEQEDLAGEPFVGKAGQLLDRMLEALGLTRQSADAQHQVFIANVLKCRPPRNRNPAPEEVAQCEPYLKRQIELVGPRVILAMGRFAVQSLLNTQEPIGRLRGRVHHYAGVPLVVTYHPAYLLRNPADKALAWSDLCLAHAVWTASAATR